MDREIVKEESTYDFYKEQTLLLTEEYKELKERIDKAVKLINKKKALFTKDVVQTKIINDLLDILEGRNK